MSETRSGGPTFSADFPLSDKEKVKAEIEALFADPEFNDALDMAERDIEEGRGIPFKEIRRDPDR